MQSERDVASQEAGRVGNELPEHFSFWGAFARALWLEDPRMDRLEDVRYWSLRRLLATLVPEEDLLGLDCESVLPALARPGLAGEVALRDWHPKSRARLAAAFELGRRRGRLRVEAAAGVAGPLDLMRLVEPLLVDEAVEVFLVLHLDARHRLLAVGEVARGTLTGSLVHPREVYRSAVIAGAAAIAVAHNHPSGNAEPSAEDLAVTRRLRDVGRLLGIPLLDHIITAAGGSRSLRVEVPEAFDPSLELASATSCELTRIEDA